MGNDLTSDLIGLVGYVATSVAENKDAEIAALRQRLAEAEAREKTAYERAAKVADEWDWDIKGAAIAAAIRSLPTKGVGR